MSTTQPKPYHLGDVLTVTTGRLMSPRRIDGVYDILNFMTGESLYTHQLPRAREECKPFLLEQHPQLAHITLEEVTPENFEQILEAMCAEYGETVMVTPLPGHAHEYKEPVSELAEVIHPDKIIVVRAQDGEASAD